MSITKFVSQILLQVTLQTNPQGTPPHADKVEHLISRIITLEDLLATPPVDAVEQAHRRELTQYAIFPALGVRTESLLGSSMPLGGDFDSYTGSNSRRDFRKVRIYPTFSKICERRYPTIGLVHHPETRIEADRDNR